MVNVFASYYFLQVDISLHNRIMTSIHFINNGFNVFIGKDTFNFEQSTAAMQKAPMVSRGCSIPPYES